ncbi:MAG: branched-chain amino acid transporter substrate-binding protein [Subtercola sp.]|nr:branched-chain amino acid transporter substrate-binding protein [Subtercola sp.]
MSITRDKDYVPAAKLNGIVGAPRPTIAQRVMRSPLLGIFILAVIILVLGITLKRIDWLTQGASALTLAVAATGLGLALGLGGEYLLGISLIFATGAYTSAIMTESFGWDYWPAALVGIIASGIVGVVMSLPGLRISHFYFGMMGFFLVYLIPSLVQIASTWTGGSAGLSVLAVPSLFGVDFTANGIFLLAGFALIIALLISMNVRSSPLGVQMRRMRESSVSLAASGVSVWRVRLATYVVCSLLAGLGGAVYGHISGFISPNEFTFNLTNLILAAVIVGGSRTLIGPVIGVIILYVLPRVVVDVSGYADFIYGAIILVSVILFRGGVVQALRDLARWIRKRVRPAAIRLSAEEETIARSPEALADLLMTVRENIGGEHTLEARGVRKAYGGVKALDFEDDQIVTVRNGQVHLLLGPNGSGKTTLLNALTGLVRPGQGQVLKDGVDVAKMSVAKIANSGVSRSFQGPSLPDEVTPVDLFASAIDQMKKVSYFHWILSDPIASRARRASRDLALRIADAAGLGPAANEDCEALTSGQRRIVDVVFSLISRSSIALLDEPAAGLSDIERRQLAATVRALAARGLGFIVVEHDLDLALSIADVVTVMSNGRPVATGTPEEIQNSAIVRQVLIGTPA